MWLVLGMVGTADACHNELSQAEKRVIAARQEAVQRAEQGEVDRQRLRDRLERDAVMVKREVAWRERERVELALAEAAEADRVYRATWGTRGAVIGVLGALACAAATLVIAVRVERAGGPKEVHYA